MALVSLLTPISADIEGEAKRVDLRLESIRACLADSKCRTTKTKPFTFSSNAMSLIKESD